MPFKFLRASHCCLVATKASAGPSLKSVDGVAFVPCTYISINIPYMSCCCLRGLLVGTTVEAISQG